MAHGHRAHTSAVDADQSPAPRRWLALVALCMAQFMLVIDLTVVQVALPSIQRDLDLSRAELTWVVTTYTLSFGGLMMLSGRLGDMLGARRLLLAGLAVFTAASLACGLATGPEMLIGGRAAQGIGAALMSPSALAIISTTFRGNERNKAVGAWGAIGATGLAVGVILSGILTAGPGWTWVFFINVPVGLLILSAVPAVVRRDTVTAERRSIDIPGALMVTIAAALFLYGFVGAGDAGWGAASTLLSLSAAVLVCFGFIALESRTRSPLMRPQTFARRPVTAGTAMMLVATSLTVSMFFLSSLFLQHTRGLGAWQTGLLFLPVAIATIAGAQLGGTLIGKVGGRTLAVVAFLLAAVGLGLMSRLSTNGNVYAEWLPGILIASFGIGPAFVTAVTTPLAAVPQEEAGVASAIINTFHELGGALGVAVVSSVAATSISSRVPSTNGYSDAFILCAIASAIAAVIALTLLPGGKPPADTVGHGH